MQGVMNCFHVDNQCKKEEWKCLKNDATINHASLSMKLKFMHKQPQSIFTYKLFGAQDLPREKCHNLAIKKPFFLK